MRRRSFGPAFTKVVLPLAPGFKTNLDARIAEMKDYDPKIFMELEPESFEANVLTDTGVRATVYRRRAAEPRR